MMRPEQSRRVLLMAAGLVLGILLVFDLLRPDSLIRGWVAALGSEPRTPLERMIERVTP